MTARGMTLLEVMVALVILGLAGAGALELFGGALRGANAARTWSRAVAYATDGMERAKLARGAGAVASPERLAGGFERYVEREPWGAELVRVRVVVALPPPGGGRYVLERLVPAP